MLVKKKSQAIAAKKYILYKLFLCQIITNTYSSPMCYSNKLKNNQDTAMKNLSDF